MGMSSVAVLLIPMTLCGTNVAAMREVRLGTGLDGLEVLDETSLLQVGASPRTLMELPTERDTKGKATDGEAPGAQHNVPPAVVLATLPKVSLQVPKNSVGPGQPRPGFNTGAGGNGGVALLDAGDAAGQASGSAVAVDVDRNEIGALGEVGAGVSAAASAAAGALKKTMMLTELFSTAADSQKGGQKASSPIDPIAPTGGGWQEIDKGAADAQQQFYTSEYNQDGKVGSPLAATMATVYISLMALTCLGIAVWVPCGSSKSQLPEGY